MDTKDLAKRLGLPEDATEEQVNTVLDQARVMRVGNEVLQDPGQAGTGRPDPTDREGHVGPTPEQSTNDPPANTGGPATVPPADTSHPSDDLLEGMKVEGGVVKLDPDAYKQLVLGARAGIEAKTKSDNEHRSRVVAAAVKDGKIPPSRSQHYLRMFQSDPEGTEKLLTANVSDGGLAAGMIPVTEQGGGGSDGSTSAAEGEGLPDEWFPQAKQRRKIAAEQSRVNRDVVNNVEAM